MIDTLFAGIDKIKCNILGIENECDRFSIVCLGDRGSANEERDGRDESEEDLLLLTIGESKPQPPSERCPVVMSPLGNRPSTGFRGAILG